ncbi:MAG: MFS transporter [Gammaproteobacteria bacterium]|nr:MFS transporter [Gammaproteobacteria bacterium]
MDERPVGGKAAESPERIPTGALLTYAFTTLPISLVNLPINIVLPSYYVQNTATSLAQIGAVSFVARAFDAAADPLVGYFSDRLDTRWGRRKPWVLAGSLVCAGAILFLFSPPRTATIVYYTLACFAFYVGYALFDVPNKAWGSEMSRHYLERSRIATFLTVASVLGALGFWLALILQVPFTHSTEINPEVFRAIAWCDAFALPVVALLALYAVPRGEFVGSGTPSLRDLVRAVRSNRLLWRFCTIVGFLQLGNGISSSVFYIFVTGYLRLGRQFAFFMLAYFAVQVSTLPVWFKLLRRFGKHRPGAASWILSAVLPTTLFFIRPGPGALWPALGLTIVMAAIAGGGQVVPIAMLGDIVDYDLLKTGVNRAGNYFAIQNVLFKLCMGAGLGIGLPLVAAFGYARGVPVVGQVKLGLMIAYVILPGVLQLVAAAVAWRFPLDARRHEIVRRRIAQRARRTGRDAAAGSLAVTGPSS